MAPFLLVRLDPAAWALCLKVVGAQLANNKSSRNGGNRFSLSEAATLISGGREGTLVPDARMAACARW
jgi:hypothetical protein